MDFHKNNTQHRTPVVDFTPAELQKGKKGQWRVCFYVMHPVENRMRRIQRRVKPIKNTRLREKFARKMIAEINDKLMRGWNPFIEMEAKHSFAIISEVFKTFLENQTKEVKAGQLRPDTMRAYNSYVKNILEWIQLEYGPQTYCIKFDQEMVARFLDHVYYDRNNSARTHNNYLSFMNTIAQYMVQRNFIKTNPTAVFRKKEIAEKKRRPVPGPIRAEIDAYVQESKCPGYGVLLRCIYYQLLRRAEVAKLKVGDIYIKERYIHVRAEISKNKKDAYISIINVFYESLKEHIRGANPDWYVFSNNRYLPGPNPVAPRKISYQWNKIRTALGMPKQYQLYSLKDSGISEMLLAGVPPLKVRDHARHSELAMTEKYTERVSLVDIDAEKIHIRFSK